MTKHDESVELPLETRPIRVSREVEQYLRAKLISLPAKQRPAAKRAMLEFYQSGLQMEHGQRIAEYERRIAAAIESVSEKVTA
jgi:hypothetical protein